MNRFTLAVALMVLATPALAEKPKTIVGKWAMPGESCKDPITLGPLSMKSTDVDCRFASVKRKGYVVTWKGVCDSVEGSSQETVIATEKNGRLTIEYVQGGNILEDLRRCP